MERLLQQGPGGASQDAGEVALRTLRSSWRRAQEEAQTGGRVVSLRDVVSTLHFKELVREARAAL